MYKKSTQKIINRIIFIVIIFAILCGIGIYILKYEVQGETNIPFEITKIAIAQSVNGIENEGHQEKWNFNVSENNDIYIYLEKNSRYNKTEIIKDVTINNIKINKTDSIGETKIYKPVEDEKVMFKNTNENETEEIVYTGEMESNIKQQKISNQGGIIAFRYAINNLSNYISNENEEVDYGKLLQLTNIKEENMIVFDNDKTYELGELKIRPLIKELRYYFTGHTTLQINSDFIVFNIKEIMNSDENIKNALFFNILKYAWGLCLDKDINTVMMVDEAHVLLSNHNELGAEFLSQIQRRARKYNTGTIVITQQPTDFAAPNLIMHGKAIFDNASSYLIMNLRKQAVDDLSKLIDLNETEMERIKYYNQGEGLLICGNRRMNMTVIATQEELDSFGSGGGY